MKEVASTTGRSARLEFRTLERNALRRIALEYSDFVASEPGLTKQYHDWKKGR